MSMLVILGLSWTMLALPLALVLGRALRSAGCSTAVPLADEVEQFLRAQPSSRAAG